MGTSLIAQDIWSEQKVWNSQDMLAYYQTHRCSASDLYQSERFFLPDLLLRIRSVLDVGCAAGGFCRIMRSYNSSLRYVGLDITQELVDLAKQNYPEGEFLVGDGVHFPFPEESFDLVHSSGVLHLNSRYQDMVKAMWGQTREYMLCDFRLTRGASFRGEMMQPPLPYFVLNVDELVSFLRGLKPRPAAIRAKGYIHEVAESACLPQKEVIMACFLLEKRSSEALMMEINLNVA